MTVYLVKGEERKPLNGETKTTWTTPLKKMCITSNYGNRYHPLYKEIRVHDGIDLRAPLGTPVYAVADGKVIASKVSGSLTSGYGNYIEIDHSGGLSSFYGHLNKRQVKVGQVVKKGQQIALSGNTGGSKGPHLHFGVHKNAKRTNPLIYLPKF